MVCLTHISTAKPELFYTAAEILAATANWMKDAPDERALFERFISSSKIAGRHFCMPIDEILRLRTQSDRAAHFIEKGTQLSCLAVDKVLSEAKLQAAEISSLIFSSCSVPTIPSIDASVVNKTGLLPTVRRVPVYQHGCAGGAFGLGLGCELTGCRGPTLVLATELCSLVFHGEDLTGGSLVGSALFADGAACALLQPSGAGLQFITSQSFLIPNSEMLMGYDLKDDGAHLRLLRELPMVLSEYAPRLTEEFLARQGLLPADVAAWLFHPGGVRILDNLETALKLKREKTYWAWDVLEHHGNMSSATILYVIESYLKEQRRAGEAVVVLGIGPGLTIELLLFRDVAA
jgi:alkylresorcinol/alkylpyrone synthase